jgi:hypothetical protein
MRAFQAARNSSARYRNEIAYILLVIREVSMQGCNEAVHNVVPDPIPWQN